MGRFSRAAVFAGALAGTGCWSSSSPRDTTVDNQQQQVETKRGPLVPGMIRGIATRSDGTPAAGLAVEIRREDGDTKHLTTNARGEFEVTGLEPANYIVSFQPWHPRQGPQSTPVTLHPEAGQEVTLYVPIPEPDRGPCCKPYGAPPARRRIV